VARAARHAGELDGAVDVLAARDVDGAAGGDGAAVTAVAGRGVWPVPTFVQTGSVFVPPAPSVAPWQ
jgi:hypothetical protein